MIIECCRTWPLWQGLSHGLEGINDNGKTDLYAIENGTLTALRYCNAILDQFVRSYTGSIRQEFILMDDNARPHHAHVTSAYLGHEMIVHMDWPA